MPWFLCAGLFAVLQHFSESGAIAVIWAIVVSAFLGVVIGFTWAYHSSAQQWPYIRDFVDIQGMKARLENET